MAKKKKEALKAKLKKKSEDLSDLKVFRERSKDKVHPYIDIDDILVTEWD